MPYTVVGVVVRQNKGQENKQPQQIHCWTSRKVYYVGEGGGQQEFSTVAFRNIFSSEKPVFMRVRRM